MGQFMIWARDWRFKHIHTQTETETRVILEFPKNIPFIVFQSSLYRDP